MYVTNSLKLLYVVQFLCQGKWQLENTSNFIIKKGCETRVQKCFPLLTKDLASFAFVLKRKRMGKLGKCLVQKDEFI